MIIMDKSYGLCIGKAIEKVEERFSDHEITVVSANQIFSVRDMYTGERLARIAIMKDTLMHVSWIYYYDEEEDK